MSEALKLRLVIDVDYYAPLHTAKELGEVLLDAATFLVGQGMLTNGLDAEVLTWDADVLIRHPIVAKFPREAHGASD